jgi:1,4-dihydroxy-2-naphthoyl-CoA hydrolase
MLSRSRTTTMHSQCSIAFTFTERTADRVVAEMPIGAGIKNPFGSVLARAILWFTDVAATSLVLAFGTATEGMTRFPHATSLNPNLLCNQTEGRFTATPSFVKRGRTVSVVRTSVCGAAGKPIADVTTSHLLST